LSKEIGQIKAIFRYPVKSMAGVRLDSAGLGWHGLDGDRRFAFRRLVDRGGFPWLSASRLPELLLYKPFGQAEVNRDLPTHVRTPDGADLELESEDLRGELSRRHGSPVEIMQFNQGIFDEASMSLINVATILKVGRASGRRLDMLRFRPNVVIESHVGEPFAEDEWLGKTLRFGVAEDSPAVSITVRDLRCVMINLDPETAEADSNVMKAAVRLNANHAGVYATVICPGEMTVGQKVFLI